MNYRLLELAEKRGRLQERIAYQRAAMGDYAAPLRQACALGDKAVEGMVYVKQHPHLALAAGFLVVVAKPRRAWAWAKRGFFAWRGYEALRRKLAI